MRARSDASTVTELHSASAGCVARACTSPCSTTSWSCVEKPRARVCSTAATSSTAVRPSARGARTGLAGVSSATASATAPPTTASSQRPTGPPVATDAGSPTMTIACTPACVVSIGPRSRNRASTAATNRTTATCHAPEPMTWTTTSPSATPSATPTASSATRRTDRLAVKPSATHVLTGAKKGYGWCSA